VPGDESASSDLRLSGGGLDDLPRLQGEDGHLLRGASAQPATGSGEGQGGASSVLARAAQLRFPDLRELKTPRERVDALIDHISDTAVLRGELEQLRLETQVDLLDARDAWHRLQIPASRSKPQADELRRRADPELAARIDRARWLIERCGEAIARMGGTDYDAASRAYTLLAGN
jgi:hypothetical protein